MFSLFKRAYNSAFSNDVSAAWLESLFGFAFFVVLVVVVGQQAFYSRANQNAYKQKKRDNYGVIW